MTRYAYLHGFASSARSHKGVALRERLAKIGIELELPDLNRPDFAHLTVEGALAAIDELDAAGDPPDGGPRPNWRFVGSSMGGYLTALWASLHPGRVDRAILLCPGFGLADRWPAILGAEAFERWRSEGSAPFPDAQGEPVAVHWGFMESALRHPAHPRIPCPTTIIHGTRDEVVPVEVSRAYVETAAKDGGSPVELVEVDDDHGLGSSVDLIEARCREWLVRHTYHWDFHGDEGPGTAAHFQRHLEEFLAREAIPGAQTGTGSAGPGHAEAWLEIDVVHEALIRRALRPQRKT